MRLVLRTWHLLPFILLAILLSTSGCQRQGHYFGEVNPPSENVFRFDNGAEPEYLDPGLMVADTDERIASMLFEGLTTKDPKTSGPRPGMAESWEISPDGLRYTFHLRPGAVWTDSHPVTAQDFVYSWTRVLDPKTGARYASQLYLIANAQPFNEGKLTDPAQLGIRALDEHTLEVRLEHPVSYFLFLTSSFTFYPVPQWVVEKYGAHWTDPGTIVGNGPFRLVEHRIHDRIVTERNPTYWNARAVKLQRVVAYSVDDPYTAANLYESGRLDWVGSSVPAEYVPYMRGRFADFYSEPFLASYFYSFNVTRPPLNNPLVRRALSMAIDRHAITDELLRGGEVPGAHFVPVGLPHYQSPPGPEYNPAEAARLLAEAGYPNGEGFPNLEIKFNTLESHRKIAEAVQQMWAKNLNIHVGLHNEEWAAFIKTRHELDFDIARDGWIADYPDPTAFLELLESDNGNNETGWKNPDYDRLVELSRRETDPARRINLLEQAESLLLRDLPVLPIYTYAVNTLIKPYVRGIYPTPQDIHPLNEVCIDRRWREHLQPGDSACN